MEAQQRRVLTRRRNPLSDCTNSLNRASDSVPIKPIKPNPSSTSAFNKPPTKPSSASTTSSSNPTSLLPPFLSTPSPPHTTSSLPGNPSSLPPSNVSTPPGPPKSFSVAGTVDLEVSEPISIVYSRRRTSDTRKNKAKAVANTVSSAPIRRISNSREKSDGVESADLPQAKALTFPSRKKQRTVSSDRDVFKDALLQDFIKKQSAYFKAIDEFKLPEEEVESIDELD